MSARRGPGSLLLAFLLHRANSDPPTLTRREFYELKDRLLDRYARKVGAEIQEIVDECYGWGFAGCAGAKCTKCGGTGVWQQFWVMLHVFQWGRYEFHRPGQRSWTRPARVHIRGRIQHRSYGPSSAEACLWLYVLTGEWSLLWRSLRGSRRYGWWAWPLLNLQRVVFELRFSLGKWRRRRKVQRWADDGELPF